MLLRYKAVLMIWATAFILMSSFAAFGATVTYTYDNLNRLIKADYGNGTSEAYTYDAAGNRVTLTTTGIGLTVTVIFNGNGSGTVTSSVGGINYAYPTTNTGTTTALDYGTPITITAIAAPGTIMSALSASNCIAAGGIIGGTQTNATCTISSLTTSQTISATFTLAPAGLPTVTTAAVSVVTATTASGGGNVTSDGGAAITAKGVCWSAFTNPTTSGLCSNDGTGTGQFVSSISGLTANTPYHVRAYATNGAGTAYGSDIQFTTSSTAPLPTVIYISDLTWTSATNGWGPVEKDMSNGESAAGDGRTISLHGVNYAKGLGVHANSVVTYNLGGQYSSFVSDIGIDDEVGSGGSVVFQVWSDGVKLYDSGIITHDSPTQTVNVDVTGKSQLQLVVSVGSGVSNDHADWAGAYLVTSGSPPPADTTAPTVPGSLIAMAVSTSEIDLSWSASTDNAGVAGYKVYRNGSTVPLASVTTGTSYADKGLVASTTYSYSVSAYDAAGNESAECTPVPATTLSQGSGGGSGGIYISDLNWISATNGWGPVEKDMSNGESAAGDGHTISLHGVKYVKGLGVHANSVVIYNLAGQYSSFVSDLGIDDEVGSGGSVVFQVWADGVKLYDSGILTHESPTQTVNVDVTGKSQLQLVVNVGSGINNDHADWAGAYLYSTSANPVNGVCGTSNGQTLTSAPATNLCSAGTAGAVSGSGPWIWSCAGTGGGTSASCSANLAVTSVNGVCGTSNGQTLTSAPTTNLCSAGTASAVSGSGPWTWSCAGTGGGTSASCSANIQTTTGSGVYLSNLTWTSATNGWNGAPKLDKANGDPGATLNPITLQGTVYAKGIGCHAPSTITYSLAGQYSTFVSDIGLDDEVGSGGSVVFQVWADGVKIFDSGIMTHASAIQHVNVNVTGTNQLQLVANVGTNSSNDHADWAGAYLYSTSANPVNGVCGTSNGQTLASAPATNLCSAGTASAVSGSGPWTWSCAGTGGGTNASCSANLAVTSVNGVCGTSNGQTLTSAPATNLCSAGTASSVSGSGPWTWSCAGTGGGTSASCSANIQTTTGSGVYLSDLNWTSATNGWGPVEKDMSNGESAAHDGHTLTINGVKYTKGLGCHAPSIISYNLGGNYSTFVSDIGIDDEVLAAGGGGSVEFQVWGDSTKLYDSGTSPYVTSGVAARHVSVNVAGVTTLTLKVLVGADSSNDHADWAGAYLVTGSAPPPDTNPPSVPGSLTATAASTSEIDLTWSASTDNVGVAGYKIYRNGALLTSVTTGTSYADKGLAASTTYSYSVSAYDAAGNESAESTPVPATTLSQGKFIQQLELTAFDGAANNYLGDSVALSADGNTALIGSSGKNSNQGAVYVFTRSGSTWSQQQELMASDWAVGDFFGWSVAMSADGNTAIIGAPDKNSNQGAVYVFTRSGSTWSQQKKLTASNWAANDSFGSSVALSTDGNTALIGAPGKNSIGAVYVFARSGSAWAQQQELIASDGGAFGDYVAMSADGNTALIGAAYEGSGSAGAAYVFVRSGSIWTQEQKLTASDGAAGDWFGSVALSADGNTALIGAPGKKIGQNSFQGAVYMFTRSGSTWSQQQELTASDGASGDLFGNLVALSADGNTALISPLYKNSAYVFTRAGLTWSQQQEVTASDGVGGDSFGNFVALSADGNTALIGAPGKNFNRGAAYVFNTPGTEIIFVSDLNWISATNGWGPVERDMSNGEQAAGDGRTISLHGVKYAKGLGVHANSVVAYNLGGEYSSFVSDIGIDDETDGYGSVIFQVWADGTKLYDSGILIASSATQHVNVSVAGVNTLQLIVLVGNGTGSDHADWAGAKLSY